MLSFENVAKSFGDRQVLRDLTFDVRPGELFGFCGANGAGKTTAMRIALGVLAADSGSVRWHGAEVDAATRRRFGYMPEERGLYAKMVPAEQLVYLARLSGVRAGVAERRAQEWMERLGVVCSPKDPLEKLSLGNQQKVQLAAALIHDPEVLVLDEPFSGLDPLAVDAMAAALLEFAARGVPIVFSSHQLELVERLCDRVGIIRAGTLVAQGTVAELRRNAGGEQLQVTLTGATRGWADRVPGVRVLSEDGRTTTLLTDGPRAAREVLAAAQAAGEVEYFGRCESGLAEIFREAVSG
ncbi:ABC-2 type transport system ATP-binding protein [Streptomyces puniciscabiei]|uniref:ABC-2 type transport system ATP-binding protein n=1 Tax=Streptomyces puniciscabiei TaxID=164348 RepID=A0A542UH85_9ACTN|nr:ATP-binding cassette domain-containing protein [Streptomyces puniciscabiei]TQK98423.1 ABC-2 type transport system ATP-binding protein [Streptomyces puniciscabiei]